MPCAISPAPIAPRAATKIAPSRSIRAAITTKRRRRASRLTRYSLHCSQRGSRSQRRDRADFDQKFFAHQPVDDEQRIGRIGGAFEQLGDFARALGHEFRYVLRMHEIGGELDEIGEARGLQGERRPDIAEDEPALRVETAWDIAVLA